MEAELKDMNSNQGSFKEERPLLKMGSTPPPQDDLDKKFAAFARNDVYGTMGWGPIPAKEKLMLVVALLTLVPLRVVGAMIVLVLYYLICRFCTLFSSPNRGEVEEDEGVVQEDYAHLEGWRRAVIVKFGRLLSRSMLFVFGFYWIHEYYRDLNPKQEQGALTQQEGNKDQSEKAAKPGAIISNHVSYLDILYHMSSSFPSFVAKRSVGKLPLVGLISKCLGCVYVQREAKTPDFKGVSGAVTQRVREAHGNESAPTMMLFPEGTTTNGDYILTFKTGAFLAGTPVQPVILRYPYHRFSPAWDSISGARHVLYLLCQFVNHMEVVRLPVYYPSQEEKDDPKLYASNIRKLMATEGNLTMSDLGLADKRMYHATLNGNTRLPTVFHRKDD